MTGNHWVASKGYTNSVCLSQGMHRFCEYIIVVMDGTPSHVGGFRGRGGRVESFVCDHNLI